MIPFKEQFDKLTRAYINDEINPYAHCACFIGNLLNGQPKWALSRNYGTKGTSILNTGSHLFPSGSLTINMESEGTYDAIDILILENKFLKILEEETVGSNNTYTYVVLNHPNYEEALFKAFSGTLDLLKRLHEGKGEKVEEFIFTKRKKYNPLMETALG